MKQLAYDYLMRFVGLPYRWGGDDPIEGFDCSGLVLEWLKALGLVANGEDLTAQTLFLRFQKNLVLAPKFGTLLFFGQGLSSITHVTVALSEKYMLEAGGGGSKTLTKADAVQQNAYVRLRPIANRTDLVARCHPLYGWSD